MKLSTSLSVAVSLAAAATSPAALWTSGHGDMGFAYDEVLDEWEPHFHFHDHEEGEEGHDHALIDGAEPTQEEYEIGDLTIQVLGPPQSGAGVVESGASTVFLLPQDESIAESLGNPFVGIAAEEIATGIFLGDTLTLSLQSVSGPGVFSLWSTDSFGSVTALMSSSTDPGSTAPDSLAVPVGSHSHYGMGFSEEGLYDVTYRIEGILASDGTTTTGTDFTVQYSVIPEPASLSLVLLGGLGLLRRRRA